MTRASDPLVGRIIDQRYEVTSRIARGGMATVYRAVDRRLDRDVALKIMHPHLAEGSDVVARFRREARAAARLTHPGIVGVYDQGSDGDTAYLTLEHVDGPNLRAVLKERGTLPLGEAMDVVEAVLDALAAAHAAGLVHRDVKPENVLIAKDGRVKVADFGLARAVTEATAATTGTVLGTVAYLSPEVVTSNVADARADVYAAGVMIFELLTGVQPLTGETAIRTAYRHVHEDIPAPSQHAPWLPVEVDELVAALTARSVTDRPRDARAALALVRRIHLTLDDETLARRADPPVEAPTEGNAEDRDPADPEPPTDEDATQALGVAASTGTVALPVGVIPPPPTTGPAEPAAPPRRRRRATAVLLTLLLLATLGAGGWWWVQVGPGAYAPVPDVTGRGGDEAVAALEAAGLTAEVSEAHDDDVEQGRVVTTSPGPDEPVRRGGTVEIVVSLGILLLQVPDVVGTPEEEALATLVDAGFPVGQVNRPYDQEVPKGDVVATNPPGGETVPHNRPIDVAVSDGREPVTIPSVVGADRATAEQELTTNGLVPDVTEDYSTDVPEGRVVAQDPAAGAALRGDRVTIVVSLGPPLVEVPDVVGRQVDEARTILEDAGFSVDVQRVLGGFFGTVRATNPAGGEQVPRGSTVRVTVV